MKTDSIKNNAITLAGAIGGGMAVSIAKTVGSVDKKFKPAILLGFLAPIVYLIDPDRDQSKTHKLIRGGLIGATSAIAFNLAEKINNKYENRQ